MDVDAKIKAIKEQRAFDTRILEGPYKGWKYCERCGKEFYPLQPTKEDYGRNDPPHETRCVLCISEHAKEVWLGEGRPTARKKRPLCGYCYRKRPRVGKWCHTCRNKYQRQIIKGILFKKKNGVRLGVREEFIEEIMTTWAVWNKEFKKMGGV